jgi:hypothetical protein
MNETPKKLFSVAASDSDSDSNEESTSESDAEPEVIFDLQFGDSSSIQIANSEPVASHLKV